MTEEKNLEDLLNEPLSSEELAWDHAMEISGSVYERMQELGLKGKDLAERLGVSPARISRILKGEQSMTLATLARLETALDMDMAQGFSHPVKRSPEQRRCLIVPFPERTDSAGNNAAAHYPNWLYQVKEG